MKGSATSSGITTPAPAARTSPRPERFRLDGPTIPIDPRTNAYRRDIADVALAGRLFAPHYAKAEPRGAVVRTPVRGAPDADAGAVTELLAGEPFDLLDSAGGWAWGACALDGYVGYVPIDALAIIAPPSHIVAARTALLFARPDIKSPVLDDWPLGTRFSAQATDGFLRTPVGFIHPRHARALSETEADPVAVAERLIVAPYRWGGRSGAGLDCSGLVQLALQLVGHKLVPRDTDLQRDALGRALDAAETLKRGDLIFFPGHVGLMMDGERLIHANAHWMAVTVEPLADVIARLAPDHDEPVTARRRLE